MTSPLVATMVAFGLAMLLVFLGLPIAFALGGAALVIAFLLWGLGSVMVVYTSVLGNALEFVLVAIPLFIFMGVALEHSGLAEDLYEAAYKWMGGLRGGLAAGTIGLATIMAAMTGISGAACVTLGVIALPAMIHRKYDKKLAMGSIMSGAALGQLIPPSVIMVILGLFSNQSVGRLFAAGVFPGLLLSSLFITYVLIRSYLKPEQAPSLPPEERVGWVEKLVALRGVILPLIVLSTVLGLIFAGLATPTEAAAGGAAATIFCTVVKRRFNWQFLKETAQRALRITSMSLWLVFGAGAFAAVYIAVGGPELVQEFLIGMQANRWMIFGLMQLSFFILGCFLDPIGIIMITLPIYLPLVVFYGFEPIWYSIIFCLNMEMAYLTPPFGFNLFYMKGVAPEGTSMGDIYRAALPFIVLQAIGLGIVIGFPQIALWLPNIIFGVVH